MSDKAFSIKDIAKKANVSITTVSFILNNKAEEKNISAAVIEKVKKIIKDYDYKPNQIARSLRSGNSKIIGLIVEDISNPFFAGIAKLIEHLAYDKGYKIFYSSTENNPLKAQELIELFESRQVDAHIIAPLEGAEQKIQGLLDSGKPVVLFDRSLAGIDASYVGVDHFKASYEAIKHFIRLKKERIALVTVDLPVQQITDRFDGYKQAIDEQKATSSIDLVLKVPFNQKKEETVSQLMLFFEKNQGIDAVLFATNYLAISGLTALKRLNRKVDEQLSVIAYDDGEVFKLHTPQISAVEQPVEEIAQQIIDLIFQKLSGSNEGNKQKIILSAKLIIRSH